MAETVDMSVVLANVVQSLTLALQPQVTFSGHGSAVKFFDELDSHFESGAFTGTQKLGVAKKALRGAAKEWYEVIGSSSVKDYSQFCDVLKRRFPEVVDRVKLEAEIYGVKQRCGEAAADFVQYKIKLLKKLGDEISETAALRIIMDRLIPDFQDVLDNKPPVTVSELHQRALKYDIRHPPVPTHAQTAPQKFQTRNMQNKFYHPPEYKQPTYSGGRNYRTQLENRNSYSKRTFPKVPAMSHRPGNLKSPKVTHVNAITLRNVNLPHLLVTLDGKPLTVLLDTGSEQNFMSEEYFIRNYSSRKRLFKNGELDVRSAQGESCDVMGSFRVTVSAQNEKLNILIHVIRNLQYNVILGMDFLTQSHAELNFQDESVTLQMKRENHAPQGKVELNLENSILSEVEQLQLNTLVQEFDTLFSETPGLTHVATHTINTGDHIPIKSRAYRYDANKDKIVKAHIDEMLKNNIIKPVESPWASPVVLCRKKTDRPITDPKAWRFAVDYRALNKITKFPSYPMPIIDDILHSLQEFNYMTTLDLTSGYFQIAMNEADILKTAFISKYGTFAFSRMAFGLCGAPATFQKTMDRVLKPLLGKNVFVYLDDIIVTSNTFSEHLKLLHKVFSLLKEAGLTVNVEKCKFARKEIKYLGYKVTQDGLHTDDSKIKAVQDFLIPKNARQLASFLGLCSYYRSFIPSFSDIAEPLYALRKKRVKFVWSSEAQKAFEMLKEKLIKAPVLIHSDPKLQFTIYADASNVGVGAVITQKGQPIAYTSRTLNAAERNYTTTEREILAILVALEKFKCYLNEKPVVVITDHAALTRLHTGKNLTPRVIRWALKLQEYNLIIEHRPGKDNRVADALSRSPIHSNPETCNCAMLTTVVLDNKDKIRDELLLDDEFSHIYQYLQDPETYHEVDKQAVQSRAQHYEIIDNLLFYKLHKNTFGELRPVIPRTMRMEVLSDLHDLPICGHMGIRKTFSRAREAVFWPNMKEWVSQFVRSCDTCQRINYINYAPAGKLQNIVATFPNEIVGIDLLGPYPRSNFGKYRYILVIADHFSKWMELIPLKRASAKAVTDSVLNRYILHYGAPVQIISDNGSQFTSQLFADLCRSLHIKHVKMVTYRPQSNIAERVNRNIVRLISAYVGRFHATWDKYINEFAYALRTAKHDSTGKTPAEVFLGRKIITPLDRMFFTANREQEFQMKDIEELLKEVKEVNDQARATQKRYYDRKRRESNIKVGDWVLRITHFLSVSREKVVGKFCPKFDGPYKVVRRSGNVVYIDDAGQIVAANVDQVKLYFQRSNMNLFRDSSPPEPDDANQSRYNGAEGHNDQPIDSTTPRDVPTTPLGPARLQQQFHRGAQKRPSPVPAQERTDHSEQKRQRNILPKRLMTPQPRPKGSKRGQYTLRKRPTPEDHRHLPDQPIGQKRPRVQVPHQRDPPTRHHRRPRPERHRAPPPTTPTSPTEEETASVPPSSRRPDDEFRKAARPWNKKLKTFRRQTEPFRAQTHRKPPTGAGEPQQTTSEPQHGNRWKKWCQEVATTMSHSPQRSGGPRKLHM